MLLSFAHKLCFQQLCASFAQIINIRSICVYSLMLLFFHYSQALSGGFVYPLFYSPQSTGEDYTTAGSNHQLFKPIFFQALKDTAGDNLLSATTNIVNLAILWDTASADFEDSYNYSFLVKLSFS